MWVKRKSHLLLLLSYLICNIIMISFFSLFINSSLSKHHFLDTPLPSHRHCWSRKRGLRFNVGNARIPPLFFCVLCATSLFYPLSLSSLNASLPKAFSLISPLPLIITIGQVAKRVTSTPHFTKTPLSFIHLHHFTIQIL